MRYLTDTQAEQIGPLQGLPQEDRTAVLADAARVYRYVSANPWVSDGDLRVWGESQGITPDAMNAALAVLRSTGKVLDLDAPDDASVVPRLDLSALDVPALDKLIAAHDLDVAKSATKDEKVLAIREATRL